MPATAGLKISTLSYVIIYVTDTEKAAKFYTEKLGLKTKVNHPGWVELETGTCTLALHGSEKPLTIPSEGAPVMVFHVDDIHEATKALKASGVTVKTECQQVCEEGDKLGLSSDFTDPDGNHLSIFGFQPKK